MKYFVCFGIFSGLDKFNGLGEKGIWKEEIIVVIK